MATEFDLEVTNDPEFDTRTPDINYRRAHDRTFRRLYDRWWALDRAVSRLIRGQYSTRDLLAFERLQECKRELVDYCERNAIELPLQIQLSKQLEAALAEQQQKAKEHS